MALGEGKCYLKIERAKNNYKLPVMSMSNETKITSSRDSILKKTPWYICAIVRGTSG